MRTLPPVLEPVVGLSYARRGTLSRCGYCELRGSRSYGMLGRARGRAKGQMPDFRVVAVGYATADCVRVKTGLVLFLERRFLHLANSPRNCATISTTDFTNLFEVSIRIMCLEKTALYIRVYKETEIERTHK